MEVEDMTETDRLLLLAKKTQLEGADKRGTFRTSGIILEDRYALLYPEHIRYKKGDPFDFKYKEAEVDVKGCWMKLHNGCIFVEKEQNPLTGTTPAYTKPEYQSSKILLCFVDYQTGIEYWAKWNKLYERIKDWDVVAGGDSAKGWIVNVDLNREFFVVITKNKLSA